MIEDAWKKLSDRKPEPAIFWQFIQDERNNVLKEYRLAAGVQVTIRPGTTHVNLQTREQWAEPALPTLYEYAMKSGPYAGRDQRDVLQQAIGWWETYLEAIEREYAARQP